MTSAKQSIVFFEKFGWTDKMARQWLKYHNIKPMKPVDKHLHGELRYRLLPPENFKRFRMLKLGHGIDAVIGFF
jgi:hypothetical protein